jgi:hypothetical protein
VIDTGKLAPYDILMPDEELAPEEVKQVGFWPDAAAGSWADAAAGFRRWSERSKLQQGVAAELPKPGVDVQQGPAGFKVRDPETAGIKAKNYFGVMT